MRILPSRSMTKRAKLIYIYNVRIFVQYAPLPGHPSGSTKVGRETTSRSKSELLRPDSVVCHWHTTESEVRSSDFEKLELRAPLLCSHGGVRFPPKVGYTQMDSRHVPVPACPASTYIPSLVCASIVVFATSCSTPGAAYADFRYTALRLTLN